MQPYTLGLGGRKEHQQIAMPIKHVFRPFADG